MVEAIKYEYRNKKKKIWMVELYSEEVTLF